VVPSLLYNWFGRDLWFSLDLRPLDQPTSLMIKGDPTKGWWDETLASTMATIARRGNVTLRLVKIMGLEGDSAVSVEEEVVTLRR
jgi:hypothetical protein